MEHLDFQAIERPILRHRSRAETSDAAVAIVDFSGRSVKGEVNCFFTCAKLNKRPNQKLLEECKSKTPHV